ncbi:hypothetical protein NE857_32940 [Nocardiopsis exhalans]|uniref:Uncharacterized protein n=1 Tax=Nocardiopsis exhalans TaxID=163604 RepID=A0ABY5DA55_9ACTN|nr:hypothetical protein [Nocardiopsis exhalans]USY19976.1 hypothetical protein NE857_32940 [Nocardiopsis exhalans]
MTVLSSHLDTKQIEAAESALPRIRRYLDEHQEALTPVPVTVEESREELLLPRAAVELLVSVLTHMAAGRGSRSSRSTPNWRLSRKRTYSTPLELI